MALAYTPGLKIKESVVVRKTRQLPIPGNILVREGDNVEFNTIVAKAQIRGHVEVVLAAAILHVEPEEIEAYTVKKVGEKVKKGEIIGYRSSFFGLSKASCTSPTDGKIEFISTMSGQVAIRRDDIPIELTSYIPGKIVKILPGVGAEIETPAAFIQGIYGIGSERHGEIMFLVDSPDQELDSDSITDNCLGKILVGGSIVTTNAIRKAIEVGAKGIIVGGIDSKELIEFTTGMLGYGVTGFEEIDLTVIVTEGFGRRKIADKTFNILKSLEGREASINGETQIRAGVVRPEIIIPRPELKTDELKEETDLNLEKGMDIDMIVRSIRAPYFGEIGRITNLYSGLQVVETGSKVRVLEMELEDGRHVIIPRANVEIIE